MPTDKDNSPRLDLIDASRVVARGCWRVEVLSSAGTIKRLNSTIQSCSGKTGMVWDLTQIRELDYISAQFLWESWGGKRPDNLVLSEEQGRLFTRLEQAGPLKLPDTAKPFLWPW